MNLLEMESVKTDYYPLGCIGAKWLVSRLCAVSALFSVIFHGVERVKALVAFALLIATKQRQAGFSMTAKPFVLLLTRTTGFAV